MPLVSDLPGELTLSAILWFQTVHQEAPLATHQTMKVEE